MKVLVSDTSVIIDLERGGLLEDMFRLPFQFAVPDILFARELKGELGDRLLAEGLRVEELTPKEVARATAIRRQSLSLSVPDTFAFAIAESRRWTLLTGDGGLRDLAMAKRLEMHGVLWLLDMFAEGGHVPLDRLHVGLSSISTHPRCRLPIQEVHKRLLLFS